MSRDEVRHVFEDVTRGPFEIFILEGDVDDAIIEHDHERHLVLVAHEGVLASLGGREAFGQQREQYFRGVHQSLLPSVLIRSQPLDMSVWRMTMSARRKTPGSTPSSSARLYSSLVTVSSSSMGGAPDTNSRMKRL